MGKVVKCINKNKKNTKLNDLCRQHGEEQKHPNYLKRMDLPLALEDILQYQNALVLPHELEVSHLKQVVPPSRTIICTYNQILITIGTGSEKYG